MVRTLVRGFGVEKIAPPVYYERLLGLGGYGEVQRVEREHLAGNEDLASPICPRLGQTAEQSSE